jgi:superfamily I DNA/RNA helicase
MRLDKKQQKAVNHLTGRAIVVAGPGSGKTTVITARILNLIHTHNVPPPHILAIAFNKKAVEEIRQRVVRGLVSKNGYPKIRTLHAFGKDIITENHERAGFHRRPSIWSGHLEKIIKAEQKQIELEAANVMVAIYKIQSKKTGISYIGQTTNPERRKREHFSHSSNDRLYIAISAEGEAQFSFEVLEWVSGRHANRREAYWIGVHKKLGGVFNFTEPLQEQFGNQLMLEMFCEHFGIPYTEHLDKHPDFENLRDRFGEIKDKVARAKRQVEVGLFDPNELKDQVVQAFAKRYETVKAKANAVDFEDMLIYSANLLETCPDIHQIYREKYPYVLVDEFQDISLTDFRLISLLSENLFAVGDDDQAIYGFRGGDSQIMLEFAKQSNVKKYKITRNYRSTATIVEHARALIEQNTSRIRKGLCAQNPTESQINVLETTPETVEDILLQELAEPTETAILARTNYEVEQIQEMLSGAANPVEVVTIHKAKGREWDKVILIHNTLERQFPRPDSDVTDERRVFYVAMMRTKTELVVLGGECQFLPEFENIRKNVGYYFRQFGYWRARRKLEEK